jgi:plastocyanin
VQRIGIDNLAFGPAPGGLHVNDIVEWTNSDILRHTATTTDGSFDIDLPDKWFMGELASRLANRVQLTSDGHKAYLDAVERVFGADVGYAQLVKLYGPSSDSSKGRRD